MKKIYLLVGVISIHISAFAQWGFMDYRDGREYQTDSVTYVVKNHLEESILKSDNASRLKEAMEYV